MSEGGNNQAIRDLVKGAGTVYTGLILEVVLAFLAQVFAANVLSVGGFGGITTGTALVNIGAIVGAVGMGEGLIRYLPRLDDDEKRALTVASYLVVVPVSLVVGLAVSLNAGFIAARVFGDASVAVSIRIFGLAIPFASILNLSISGVQGQKRPNFRVYVENVVRPVSRFVLVVAVVVLVGDSQAGIAAAYAIPFALASATATYLFVGTLPNLVRTTVRELRRNGTEHRRVIGEVVRYSLPFTLYGAAGFVFRGIDIFLILAIHDSFAVGAYGVAYAAARLVLMFSTAFNFLGGPISSELEATDGSEGMVRVGHSVIRWLLILSVPAIVPFVFFPTEFISFIYRPDYASGALALAILSVGFAAHNVLSVQSDFLRGLGSSREMAIYSTVAAAVNVALNLLLIPEYYIAGAAVATVAAYLVKDLLMTYRVRTETGHSPFPKQILPPLGIAAVLFGMGAFVTPVVPKNVLGLLGFSFLFALTYVAAIVAVQGFTEHEVMLVRSAEEKYDLDLGRVGTLVERFS